MAEHKRLHDDHTLTVEIQKQYGRTRYSACNELAAKFAKGLDQKTFVAADLKWIQSLGYTVLVIGKETVEFKL